MVKQDPRDLSLPAIPYPRVLDLAVMIDLMLDLFFFFTEIMFDPCFFAMGSMIFYEERGQRRREGKTPSRSSFVGLLTTCALPLFFGVVRRIKRRPIRRLSVLFWYRTPHSNGACPTHFGHYLVLTRIRTFQRK